ncbi:AraC family transcriptional regulator [Klebsiella aerogenes]|uniref:AraC family transcriptional regulator n=1 Tax=Klebsiella aerogenes TaxID=548 RepID=UPI000C793FB7|nr:AraC family transcriptional regulator [Klebsiella aerogenes]EKZ5284318.1 AraC family transcriptional regulator [Klebsiella aerogenes]MCR1575443.1 AraC family transcriptional regulator [Klebsiella aerogenes]MDT4311382.1 AraC family transcriptional regulator [Klebsiella aerogenes]MDT4322965.1 AraC family transcriptional regulator [Klebsiella aerogenes]PLC37348.1 AraC family transcriptional regulator [Klebsiella aerogenes]
MTELSTPRDWVYRAPETRKVERIEAYFSNHGYDPHRHDTYAIGRTLSGVQSFHYRGEMQHSLPGNTMVLHPDEIHDGEAGTNAGFHYRMVYIEPAMIQSIIKGKPLPFIRNGVTTDARLFRATSTFLQSMDCKIEPMEEDDALYDLAISLVEASGATVKRKKHFDYVAAEKAREYIHANLDKNITLDELENNTSRDRWSLSRDFRLLFGTSPHRYMTMRRLDIAKSCLMVGESITDAALISGFFDQSHMARHFTKTFGLTPAHWRDINRVKNL